MNIRRDNRSLFSIFFVLFIGIFWYLLNKKPVAMSGEQSISSDNLFFFILLFWPFFALSIYELVRIPNVKRKWSLALFVLAVFSLIPLTYFLCKNQFGITAQRQLNFSVMVSAALIGLILLMCSNRHLYIGDLFAENLKTVVFFRVFVGFIAFWSSFFYILLSCSSPKIIIFVFSFPFLSDTCAYFIGRFGHRRIFSLSPNKTLEGFIAPIVILPILVFLAMYFLTDYTKFIPAVVCSIFFALFSNLGDLFFSSQKRNAGIKDFSNIFLGHGGFWDRFDSHCFVLSFFALVLASGKISKLLFVFTN